MQLGLQARQRGPYDLFEWLPLLGHTESPGFQARHLQHIADQAIQPVGLVTDGLQQFTARGGWEHQIGLQEAAGRTRYGG